MARVYVAGPYTKGDVALNVRRALEAGHLLYNVGHIPYIPHLTHFWHLVFPRPYHEWLHLDTQWLALCHVLIRLKGDSYGADAEVTLASSLHMPILYEGNYLSLQDMVQSIGQHYRVGGE